MIPHQKKTTHEPFEDPQENEKIAAIVNITKQLLIRRYIENTCKISVYLLWHALGAHEPLGGINRLRKDVYERSAQGRGGCLHTS